MDDDERRTILEAVAAGRLAPDEAAARLQEETAGGERPGDAAGAGPAVATVRVDATAASVRVTADHAVREAVVEGRHRVRRDGDTLVVEPDLGVEGDDDRPMRVIVGRGRWMGGRRGGLAPALRVRMNPALALELGLHASSAWVDGVEGPIRGEVSAGHLRVNRFRGPLELSVNAGSLDATGTLDAGASRISCDAGRVRLRLDPASNVRVTARVNLGRLELRTADRADRAGTGQVVLGDGRASLDVEGNLAKVEIDAR